MAEIYQEPDENVGETFLSTDNRYDNRRIKILGILANHEVRGPLYRYVVVTDDGNKLVVSRRGKLSFQTLKREYRRVSK
jgi:hypothetical protein